MRFLAAGDTQVEAVGRYFLVLDLVVSKLDVLRTGEDRLPVRQIDRAVVDRSPDFLSFTLTDLKESDTWNGG